MIDGLRGSMMPTDKNRMIDNINCNHNTKISKVMM